MNDLERDWLEELKTTEKPQVTGFLTAVDEDENLVGYCCLGVLCEMLVERGTEFETVVDGNEGFVTYDGESGTLPEKAWRGLDLENGNPKVIIENLASEAGYESGATYWLDQNGKSVGYSSGEWVRSVYQPGSSRFLVNEYVTELNDEYGLTFAQIAQLIEYAGGLTSR